MFSEFSKLLMGDKAVNHFSKFYQRGSYSPKVSRGQVQYYNWEQHQCFLSFSKILYSVFHFPQA